MTTENTTEKENLTFAEIPDEPKKPEADNFYDDIGPEKDLHAIYDIPVQVSAVLGRTTMQVSQLLKLGRGAVVNLDRRIGEPHPVSAAHGQGIRSLVEAALEDFPEEEEGAEEPDADAPIRLAVATVSPSTCAETHQRN